MVRSEVGLYLARPVTMAKRKTSPKRWRTLLAFSVAPGLHFRDHYIADKRKNVFVARFEDVRSISSRPLLKFAFIPFQNDFVKCILYNQNPSNLLFSLRYSQRSPSSPHLVLNEHQQGQLQGKHLKPGVSLCHPHGVLSASSELRWRYLI